MVGEHNRIFERIFNRVEQEDDEIIAYIAYGLYKEQKRDFLIERREALNGPVPQEDIEIYLQGWTDGQVDLVWNAAAESLGRFAISYSEIEKKEAVRDALAIALKGSFWKQVGITTVSTVVVAIGSIILYFVLRFIGFDLLDKLSKLEQMFPMN